MKRKVVIWSVITGLVIVGLICGIEGKQANLGAVVANGIKCADIGRSILAKGGSAVDAAIATLFCDGVSAPQSLGIGGGFLATIYRHSDKTVQTLVAREAAPLKSTEDMFVNKTIEGALSVAIPAEIRGYWSLHQQYGRLPWSTLVLPTIHLCLKGIPVSGFLHRALKKNEHIIRNESSHLKEIFIDPKTNEVWNEGDLMRRPQLARTLLKIARDGAKAIYDGGRIGKLLVSDIAELGGIITEEDLKQYKVRWREPLVAKILGGYALYTTPLPGSGIVLTLILKLLDGLITNNRSLFYHRLVETFKHSYGQRAQLGDDEFISDMKEFIANISNPTFIDEIRSKIFDDKTFANYSYYGASFSNVNGKGTANMAVLAPNGDAITVTSTINTIFGAKFRSKNTGIILNDQMHDFSTPGQPNIFGIPPSPANFIKPLKMPISSMCPSIVLNENGEVSLLIGAAGASKITTSVAQVIIKYLIFNETLSEAVQSKRLHHQLAPMTIQHERDFDREILYFLSKTINHTLEVLHFGSVISVVSAIGIIGDKLEPVNDHRRNGSAAIYNEKEPRV